MKRIILFGMLLLSVMSYTQNGINYKAIINDINGNVVANESVTIQFIILQGGINVYQETHSVTTNTNGLIIVNIGDGTTTDDFADIDWNADEHFLQVLIDTGSGYVNLGTTQFMAVPYALSATNVNGLEAIDEGNGIGWRLVGRNPDNYGNIGFNGIDLSYNLSQSTVRGATGDYSTTLGSLTEASGIYSTALGRNTIASGFNATAMGSQTTASGIVSTALGHLTEVTGDYSTAMGSQTTASGDYSTALGSQTTASGPYSTAIGRNTSATGNYATAMGRNSTATFYATAIGDETLASGSYSTAIGRQTTASGNNSTAIGRNTIASAQYATSMGNETEASAAASTAMGGNTTASGNYATAMGFNSTASSAYSTATGHYTTASGFIATAMGNRTIAPSFAETVIGTYNTNYTPNASLTWDSNDRLFVIGNGESGSRSNAMVVLKNGNTGFGISTPQERLHIANGRLRIGTETIEDTGSNQLSFNADLLPDANNTMQLGNSNFRWSGLWATDGTINTSDKRDKTNITTINYGLSEVLKMNPVSFNWKNKKDQDRKLGLIAQDLLMLVPEVVKTHEWQTISDEENAPLKKVELDRLGVYYSDLIPVLINAIKEQQEEIESLQSTIKNQERIEQEQSNTLEALLIRISALEQNINR